VQRSALVAAAALSIFLFIYLFTFGESKPWLFLIGIALGVTLYHAAFGFTGAYRRAILQRDISGVTAQMVMLAAAMVLFAPVLAAGEVFGHGVIGAVAPVSISMAFGALIFGIGMQTGGACASAQGASPIWQSCLPRFFPSKSRRKVFGTFSIPC